MSPALDRRVIVDRRSDESTALWLDGVDRRRNEFRFGRRGEDQYPDPHYDDRAETVCEANAGAAEAERVYAASMEARNV